MDDAIWLEAAARVSAELDEDTRAEARDLLAAEAARCRLVDRDGWVTVRLVGGHLLEGSLIPEESVADHLWVEGRVAGLVAVRSVLGITGGRPRLRDEPGRLERTLSAALRQRWMAGDSIRVLRVDGGVHLGVPTFVGADHVDLHGDTGELTLPFASVAAWLMT
jgi:hypothetical protein